MFKTSFTPKRQFLCSPVIANDKKSFKRGISQQIFEKKTQKFDEKNNNIISLSKAAAIYKQLTGKRKSLKVLAEIMHERPHLAFFDFDIKSGRPRFIGVRKDRWVYFLNNRFLMYGIREIFHQNEL